MIISSELLNLVHKQELLAHEKTIVKNDDVKFDLKTENIINLSDIDTDEEVEGGNRMRRLSPQE